MITKEYSFQKPKTFYDDGTDLIPEEIMKEKLEKIDLSIYSWKK